MTPAIEFREEGHVYLVNGVVKPSVTQILGAFDHELDRVNPDLLADRAALGTAVHKAIELDIANDLDPNSLHERVAPYFAQWRRFVAEISPTVRSSEQQLYNALHDYVGTSDLTLSFGRFKRATVDVKTGVKRPWHALQTAGYACATEQDGEPVDGRFCLHLTPSTYHLEEHSSRQDRATFLSAVALHRWMTKEGIIK